MTRSPTCTLVVFVGKIYKANNVAELDRNQGYLGTKASPAKLIFKIILVTA